MPYLSDCVDAVCGHDHPLIHDPLSHSSALAAPGTPRMALTQQELPRGETVFPRKYRWPYELPTFNGGPLHQNANRQSAL